MKKLAILALVAMLLTGCSFGSTSKEPPTMDEVNEVLANYEGPNYSVADDVALDAFYKLDVNLIEEYVILKPNVNTQAHEVLLVTAKEGEFETVKEQVDTYFGLQEQSWSTYLPDQYDLIKNRVTKEVGNTYIVVVHEEADAIVDDLVASFK